MDGEQVGLGRRRDEAGIKKGGLSLQIQFHGAKYPAQKLQSQHQVQIRLHLLQLPDGIAQRLRPAQIGILSIEFIVCFHDELIAAPEGTRFDNGQKAGEGG